jgi:hypothetical protein
MDDFELLFGEMFIADDCRNSSFFFGKKSGEEFCEVVDERDFFLLQEIVDAFARRRKDGIGCCEDWLAHSECIVDRNE